VYSANYAKAHGSTLKLTPRVAAYIYLETSNWVARVGGRYANVVFGLGRDMMGVAKRIVNHKYITGVVL
jgi:hypothetical protein